MGAPRDVAGVHERQPEGLCPREVAVGTGCSITGAFAAVGFIA